MARDWRSLALAALTAAALALTGVLRVPRRRPPPRRQRPPRLRPRRRRRPPGRRRRRAGRAEAEAKPKRKKQDPVEAQRAIEGAVKLLESGKAEQAVQALTTTISGGNLPPAIMAKALLYRGMAYRQQQKPAQAISDITGALWLKGGLSPTDRTNALQQRAAAYQEAGLTESGEPLARRGPAAAVRPKPRSARRRRSQANRAAAGVTVRRRIMGVADQAGAIREGGGTVVVAVEPIGQRLGQLVRRSDHRSASQTAAGAAQAGGGTVRDLGECRIRAQGVLELQLDERHRGAQRASRDASTGATQRIETAAITPARPEGRFRVQVAMVRSQDEARAVAAKVKRDYAGALASREPEIDQAVVGNMGSFYRVRVGPFATQNEGQAACARLKGSGLDCLVVTQ